MTKSIYDKRYLTEAQAMKAGIKAGMTQETATAQLTQDGKMFIFKQPNRVDDHIQAAIKKLQEAIPTATEINELYEQLNWLGCHGVVDAVIVALDEAIAARAIQLEEGEMTRAEQAKQQKGTNQAKRADWVHSSSTERPTKKVWIIADEMYALAEKQAAELGGQPNYPTRAEVQAACVRQGIASGTARTQFQHWFKQRADSAKEVRAIIDPATGKVTK